MQHMILLFIHHAYCHPWQSKNSAETACLAIICRYADSLTGLTNACTGPDSTLTWQACNSRATGTLLLWCPALAHSASQVRTQAQASGTSLTAHSHKSSADPAISREALHL